MDTPGRRDRCAVCVAAVRNFPGGEEGRPKVVLLGWPLAGAVAFDSVTDFFRRYRDFALLGRKGTALQALARIEVGGTQDESLGVSAAKSAALASRDRR